MTCPLWNDGTPLAEQWFCYAYTGRHSKPCVNLHIPDKVSQYNQDISSWSDSLLISRPNKHVKNRINSQFRAWNRPACCQSLNLCGLESCLSPCQLMWTVEWTNHWCAFCFWTTTLSLPHTLWVAVWTPIHLLRRSSGTQHISSKNVGRQGNMFVKIKGTY